jgi:hypothetical protein
LDTLSLPAPLSDDVKCQLRQLWQLEAYAYERLQQLSARCAGSLRPQVTRAFVRCLDLGGLLMQQQLELPLPAERRFLLQPWSSEARHLGGLAQLLAERYERLAREPSARGAVARAALLNARSAQTLAEELLQEERGGLRRCA